MTTPTPAPYPGERESLKNRLAETYCLWMDGEPTTDLPCSACVQTAEETVDSVLQKLLGPVE